ncbi:MAG: uracil-DNA glycosylase family protein [Chloroflexi bacterium]|nr:uracil-DNA glycosylase family protein [Chloroflexota bacterium]
MTASSEQEPSAAELQKTPDMRGLAADVRACRACELAGYLQHANPIAPGLLTDARMMLIGQAPGLVTDRKGYHFAGPAGMFLDRWLDRAGFAPNYFREHVYLTSLTRCFPGKAPGGNGDRPPSRAELALCRHFLDSELELLRPRVVLLVGRMAIDAFLPKKPLTELIGSVFEIDARTYVPLPHASGVSRWLNDPENRARLDAALAQLSRLRIELKL